MHTVVTNMIGTRECQYTFNGINLANLRRAELYRLARALDLGSPDSSKNEMLLAMIAKLNMMSAEQELTDLIEE